MNSPPHLSPFPLNRPRRLRQNPTIRSMVRETTLSPSNLILPVFVLNGKNQIQDVPSMPGVQRFSVDQLFKVAEDCLSLGIPAVALFPVIDPSLKTPSGAEALNPDGLVPNTLKALKQRFPELALITDIALDPYTSHGQDGLIDSSGYVLNDETVSVLTSCVLADFLGNRVATD